MSYRVKRETEKKGQKLSDNAENNTAVASTDSNELNSIELHGTT